MKVEHHKLLSTFASNFNLRRYAKEKAKKEAQQKLDQMERVLGSDGEEVDPEDEEQDDDGIPPACPICLGTWDTIRDPVVTRCKHYFCEHCALRHNSTQKLCFVCLGPTGGTFNAAKVGRCGLTILKPMLKAPMVSSPWRCRLTVLIDQLAYIRRQI